jgi:Tol biopolymer transport system component
VDTRSGESRLLFDAPWSVWDGTLSRDGAYLFYSYNDEDQRLRLVRRDVETGQESLMYRTPFTSPGIGLFGLSVSPDGRQIAFAVNVDGTRMLLILPAAGGTPREVLRSDRLFSPGAFGWTPDGRYLVFSAETSGIRHDREQLVAISVDTGEMLPLGIEAERITSRMVSTDGRKIVFTESTRTYEVRTLRNIRPPSGAAR